MGENDEALDIIEKEAESDELKAGKTPEELEADKKAAEKTDEVEIVLDDEGSQPENRGIRKRINKLNAKVRTAQDDQSATAQELAAEKQKSELLQLALDQKNSPSAPNPNDFEDGAADAKFVEASTAHIQSVADQTVQKAVSNLPKSEPVDHDLERRQRAHYERADKLGIKDFEDAEDEAISILGRETVKYIIAKSNKSELILYDFGKNPRRAEAFADLVASDVDAAKIELGRLGERLKVKPLAKTQQVEPDGELEGGSADTTDAYERQLDKLRNAAAGGTQAQMTALMEFKRKHQKAA